MTSWLHKQRKQTILDLSNEAGLTQDAELLKDELIDTLEDYLKKNQSRLSRNPAFEHYYGTRRTPFKTQTISAVTGAQSDEGEVKSVVKARGRRATKVKDELADEEEGPSKTVSAAIDTLTRTPAAATAAASSAVASALRPRRRSDLPASPADVAEDVEYAANRIYTGFENLYYRSGVPERIESLREICSSVIAVQATFLILEAHGLQKQVLPFRYAFDIPAVHLLGLSTPSIAVKLPDLFMLLTGHFWSSTLLWSTTSILGPLLVAYFYNLSAKDVRRHGARVSVSRYAYDPMTFNIAKALLTYVVYGRGYFVRFSAVEHAVAVVNEAMLGGYTGVLIGSFVGVLVSLYDAAQAKRSERFI